MSDTLARLRQAEMRRQSTITAHREARAEVIRLIRQAREEGIYMTRVAEESGISRQNLYAMLRAEDAKEVD